MFIAADKRSPEEGWFDNNKGIRMITRVTGSDKWVGVNARQRITKHIMAR